MVTPVRVVGLDLSLTGTGIASSLGWVQLVGHKGLTVLPLSKRIEALDALTNEILMYVGRPHLVVVESPSFGSRGGAVLERSALWWLVVRGLIRRGVPLAGASPKSRAKYATGRGNAAKSAVIHAVASRLPQFATDGNDNLVDAVVLAAMGADWMGHALVVMPQAHRAALAGVAWPEHFDKEDNDDD